MPIIHDSLPTHYMNRMTKNGLSYNVLVVGPTGIGKTTLINSLFDFEYQDIASNNHSSPNVSLNISTYSPPSSSIDLKLTIIETKGFNDQLDKSNSHRTLVEYIDTQFEKYAAQQQKVQSTRYNQSLDTRVHCCIYMFAPTGYGLKAIDLSTMKELHHRVCLIPVIGKSDVLTKQERAEFKERILREIAQNDIRIYKPSEDIMTHSMPFAVSASNDILVENGKKTRARIYPWGKLSIEQHSEFCQLRSLAFTKNMLALIQETHQLHYENYRAEVAISTKCCKVLS